MLVGALLVPLGGCIVSGVNDVGDDVPEQTVGEGAGVGGFGLPIQPSAGVPGARGPLLGSFAVEENGCFSLVTPDGVPHWIIWPRSARDDGAQVLLGDGTAVSDGDVLAATGALMSIEDAVPEFSNPDSYFGAFGRYCQADVQDVAVLDDVALD